VRRDRIYLSPSLPYGWIDAPPSINRFVGLEWLSAIFFPQARMADDAEIARRFYRLFYRVELNDAALALLFGRTGSPSAN
jgi:iron complex transport system substrate-binding protein